MTLVQLRHLMSVAETGSFTRSSELLHLTQPALSRSIAALEEELCQPLFDRIGRRSELTPFGAEVLRRARKLVFEADDLVASGQLQVTGQNGTLRLGMGSSPSTILTAPLLKAMASRYPSIQVEIARGPTERLVLALRERQLDALIIDPRSLPATADLKVTDVVEMRGAMMCRPGHPLTKWHGKLPFAALRQYVMAATPWSDEVGRQLIERYGSSAHLDECITVRCDDLRSLVEVARDSDVVLLAVRAAAPELAELHLTPPLNTPARYGIVTLAGRSEATGMSLVRSLVEKLLNDRA